jgi:3-hydroxy-9,10-secoandrosta-1,3,5(10)-triene-9,17-dione monooxygenase reductase component
MSIDPRHFRQTVGQFVTGVTVIAMEVDGHIRALTANSFTSLSLNPPLVLFCLGKGTKAGQLIHEVAEFSVNILSVDQQPLSSYFAGIWKDQEAPPTFSFTRGEGGPRLDGAVAALGCQVNAVHEGGDHWIVVGQVVSIHRSELPRAPLVFFGGRYSALADEQSTSSEEPGLLISCSEPAK